MLHTSQIRQQRLKELSNLPKIIARVCSEALLLTTILFYSSQYSFSGLGQEGRYC